MQTQSNSSGAQNDNTVNSKRVTYIVSGAFIAGIVGYYLYHYNNNRHRSSSLIPTDNANQNKSHSIQHQCTSSSSSSQHSTFISQPSHHTMHRTKIWNIECNAKLSFADYLQHAALKEAGQALSRGEVVAFPTETVYGLGGNAWRNEACSKIFTAKGRPNDNPLIVHISERWQLQQWILRDGDTEHDQAHNQQITIAPILEALMDKFWPGPLSIVLPYGGQRICSTVRGGGQLKSVAVRMPSNDIARALISLAGCPIAAPSANISGRPSPTKGQHAIHDLNGKIYGILDCGAVSCQHGLESTVIKLEECGGDSEKKQIVILRPGAVTKQMILEVVEQQKQQHLFEVVYAKKREKSGQEEEESVFVAEAPGMKYRHYAPQKPLYLVKDPHLFSDMYWYFYAQQKLNEVVFIITTQNTLIQKANEDNKNIVVIGDRNDLSAIGANLFQILRKIDDEPQYENIQLIFCEVFDLQHIGVAIMNRLQKASQSNKIIETLSDLHSIQLS
eukprot:CAMPEP_0197023754 /NCGR_PEP_ID=MMETSP1384-20130603/4402_1 /TAXON_ID=29189 /ORGANISM="Ammonia sp." /LENGTH=502 /DNA_ID=CAMNT_0042452015 /DNA_START=43 /DNA_END=1551 /DNA_ORIENTATION=+